MLKLVKLNENTTNQRPVIIQWLKTDVDSFKYKLMIGIPNKLNVNLMRLSLSDHDTAPTIIFSAVRSDARDVLLSLHYLGSLVNSIHLTSKRRLPFVVVVCSNHSHHHRLTRGGSLWGCGELRLRGMGWRKWKSMSKCYRRKCEIVVRD